MRHQHTPWAVRRESLPAIAALMQQAIRASSDLTSEQIQARVAAHAAAAGQGPRMAGAVAVISLSGLITPAPSLMSMLFGGGGSGLIAFRQAFREAVADPEVGAIVLDIDSPGGLVDLVPETAAEIRAARGTKPIIAVANTFAASAAYWIAAQADEVVVTPSGEAGSIGVYMVHEDWSKFNADMGVDPTYISAGKFKTDGNPDEPLSDTARAAMQQSVDDLYAMFVADVAAGRGTSEASVRDGYGEGRVLLASRAVSAGLADRVATLEETVSGLVVGTPESPAPAPAARAQSDRTGDVDVADLLLP